jgi:hypothetical protein
VSSKEERETQTAARAFPRPAARAAPKRHHVSRRLFYQSGPI